MRGNRISNNRGEAAQAGVRCAIYTRKSTDEGLDQAFNTLDAQREQVPGVVREHVRAEFDHFVGVGIFKIAGDRYRKTGRDLANDRNANHVATRTGAVHQFDSTGNVPVAPDHVAALKNLEVVVNNTCRGYIQLALNIPNSRRVVIVVEEMLDEIED